MYQHFFKLREKPFSMLTDPAFFYLSDQHQRALSLLRYGILEQVGFSVITGDAGCGKTSLLRRLFSELDKRVVVGLVSNAQCEDFTELLQWILLSFGLEYRAKSKVELYDDFTNFLIKQYAAKRRVVLVIDEAQHLGVHALEQLRMLSNVNAGKHHLLQVVLVGQPSLWQQLARPELEQFVQRIGVDYFLKPLDQGETAHYIRHRLQIAGGSPELFDDESMAAVWRYTNGVPRLINLLCDSSLVYAYADQWPTVERKFVDEVMRDKGEGLSRVWSRLSGPGAKVELAPPIPVEREFPRPVRLNDGGGAK